MNNSIFYSIILILLAIISFQVNNMFSNRSGAEVRFDESYEITMYRGEGCNCCVKWADYLELQGFIVKDQLVDNLLDIKTKNGVSSELASCHTAKVQGYVVEGHVPAEDIYRMLEDRPEALGIAVPGMPLGAPGMESSRRDSYQVILFDDKGNHSIYSQY